MTMIPQDRDPMLVKARMLLDDLKPEQRMTLLAFGRRPAGEAATADQEQDLVKLGLIERRRDGPALTELGEIVHALMADAVRSGPPG